MLKITTQAGAKQTKLILEGRLAGPWVEELERCWNEVTATRQSHAMVDLSGVTFIDPTGKLLLIRMWKRGAQLHASGCMTACIVEEIMATDRVWEESVKTDCADNSRSGRKGKRKRN